MAKKSLVSELLIAATFVSLPFSAMAHSGEALSNFVATHLAVHRAEYLIAIHKLDKSFGSDLRNISVEALNPANDSAPAYHVVVSDYPGATGSPNALDLLLDKKGKPVKETVIRGVASQSAPSWPGVSPLTLVENAQHYAMDQSEKDSAVDEFIDATTSVTLSQKVGPQDQVLALVDVRSSESSEVYEVTVATDGTVLSAGFIQ